MAINSNFRTLTADNIEGVVAPRNYLKNSFENGTTAGWTEMAVTLTSGLPTGTPTISSTAASSIALTNTTTTPLSLSRSLLVTGAAGWTAGQGFISDEFTIDRMDAGKPLTVSFDYELKSGTLNFSGTLGSQTLMVYIYDATAGAANWIQPAGYLGMNQSSGPGRVTATFQSSVVAGQKYRVAVIASQAVGSACSLEFDNFTCSRVTAPIGPVVTDWVSYTPTWSSSGAQPGIGNGTINGRWRRVGDSIECDIGIVGGSTTSYGSGTWFFGIPSGLQIDTSKIASNTGESPFGFAGITDLAITNYSPYSVSISSTNTVFIRVANAASSFVTSGAGAGQGTPVTLGSGDLISLNFRLPIQGWSSSVQMSNDTDTRVVAFEAKNNTAFAWSGGVYTTINAGWSATRDTHSGFNSSNGTFTVPVSGYWVFRGGVVMSSLTVAFSTELTIQAGSNEQRIGRYFTQGGSANTPAVTGTTTPVYCNAGDIVSIRVFSTSAMNLTADVNWNVFGGYRLSGPSVIAASETVACYYDSGGTQVNIPNNSITTCTVFTNKLFDTHNAFSAGGTFTAPVSGTYSISGQIQFGINGIGLRAFYAVGPVNSSILGYIAPSTTVANTCNGTTLIKLNAGQQMLIKAFQNSGGLLANSTDPAGNYVSIVRVGN